MGRNRCSDCNKFVSTEVEFDSAECDDFDPESGIAQLTITLNKNCVECGSTLATAEIEAEVTVNDFVQLCKEADWQES